MGVRPTHLDSHQYRLIFNGKELFDAMLRVAHEYKLPIFVTRDWFADHPYLQASLGPDDIVLDHTVTVEAGLPPEKWAEFYVAALKNLAPGVTEFVIHPGYDDDELRAATRERPHGVQPGDNATTISLPVTSLGRFWLNRKLS